MTIAELWIILEQYPDDMELFIGYIDCHNIENLPFEVIEICDSHNRISLSFMYDDINIINN